MDRNHFSAQRLRAPGEPVSKAVSCWQTAPEPEPSPTQLGIEALRKSCKACSKSASEKKSTTFEYGSSEDKEKELSKKPELPSFFTGQREPKEFVHPGPPKGVGLKTNLVSKGNNDAGFYQNLVNHHDSQAASHSSAVVAAAAGNKQARDQHAHQFGAYMGNAASNIASGKPAGTGVSSKSPTDKPAAPGTLEAARAHRHASFLAHGAASAGGLSSSHPLHQKVMAASEHANNLSAAVGRSAKE